MTGTSPTTRQRELGKRLMDLRSQQDLSVEDVAEKLRCSATEIRRLETGARRPTLREVRDLSGLYGIDESTSVELAGLARGAREQVWWSQYEDINLDPYLALEQMATSITSYAAYYVPGLLQTKEYSQAVIKAIAPRMNPDIYQQRVEVRMRRQQALEGNNWPRYRVLLDEAVLRRAVGGPAIMAVQIDKILAAEHSGKAAVQIVPFDVGANPAQDSNFVLLEFAGESHISPVVFVEGLTGNQYLEGAADIGRYREAIEYLLDSALSRYDSVERMIELRKAHLCR